VWVVVHYRIRQGYRGDMGLSKDCMIASSSEALHTCLFGVEIMMALYT
jgi:hypothetical protein